LHPAASTVFTVKAAQAARATAAATSIAGSAVFVRRQHADDWSKALATYSSGVLDRPSASRTGLSEIERL
jgi:hypothetical protein